jgi:hypothetical protein
MSEGSLTNSASSSTDRNRIPKEDESAFYDELDKRAKLSSEASLRRTTQDKVDLEIRVWIGFGLDPVKGMILRKRGAYWKAVFMPPLEDSGKKREKTIVALAEPVSGWDVFWTRLETQDILSLPDDSVVGAVEPFPDSEGVFVEVLNKDGYRNYSYNAPCESKVDEGRKLVNILEILSSDLNINMRGC